MLELAERCEKATGPDREIDCLIRETLDPRWKPAWRVLYYGKPTGEHVDRDDDDRFVRSPSYTASLDAAMTLVPEGMVWGVDAYADHAEAVVRHLFSDGVEVRARTPALALCAAALRARAADTPSVKP